jgi:hypothetical protein
MITRREDFSVLLPVEEVERASNELIHDAKSMGENESSQNLPKIFLIESSGTFISSTP